MNKQEQISYLANIYHVVLADGGMNRLEGKEFEDISRDIGAGYFEKKKAKELAQEELYEFLEVSLGRIGFGISKTCCLWQLVMASSIRGRRSSSSTVQTAQESASSNLK
jgi:hypothetical protein